MRLINIVKTVLICFILNSFISCGDFFEPDNKTVLPGDEYMKEASEMYSGFVGVITKLQAIGDKSIYLTDIRAETFEPTGNSPEMYALYNYDSDLKGNTYADPAKYYDVIHACNDYLQKVKEYKDGHKASVDMSHYKGMVSGMLRVKAWTYFMLGKIYGQAVWFDEPLNGLTDYPDPIDLDQIINKCDNLLEVGFDGVDGKSNMSWTEWIIATDEGAADKTEAYYYWDRMSLEYFALAAELELWKPNPNYNRVAYELILPRLNEEIAVSPLGDSWIKWLMCLGYNKNFGGGTFTYGNTNVAISLISYKYDNHQMHELYDSFIGSNRKLRPAVPAVARYRDPNFNPVPDGQDLTIAYDSRESTFMRVDSRGNYYYRKYNKNTNDCPIYIYRSHDLYFMLIEAFNHLGKYEIASALLNKGLDSAFPSGGVTWEGFTDYWTKYTPRGNRGYSGDIGVRGSYYLTKERTLLTGDNLDDKKHNDLEMLREIILEQPGEGKTYPAMLRLARRYNDYNIIADFVCPKYEESQQADIRSKILGGDYFVPWDINSLSSTH